MECVVDIVVTVDVKVGSNSLRVDCGSLKFVAVGQQVDVRKLTKSLLVVAPSADQINNNAADNRTVTAAVAAEQWKPTSFIM